MARLLLKGVKKRYGDVLANSIEHLEVDEGEVLSLLGPSGCGKTTTLRIIAGLIRQDEGDLFFDERLMNDVPPERRNTALVFQNYALFPHMNVFNNVAFGLQVRKTELSVLQRKVHEALDLVRLSGYERRFPNELSGGQQQRVALARAVVIDPDVLLFDEPLSNLDARLRDEMRFELREFLKKLKITSIYVTHDQAEAVVLSDRIAVMEHGRVRQLGRASALYSTPASKFVAGFMGKARFIPGTVNKDRTDNGLAMLMTPDGLEIWARTNSKDMPQQALAAVRPEAVRLFPVDMPLPGKKNSFKATVESTTEFGDRTDYEILLGQWRVLSTVLACEHNFPPGTAVAVLIDPLRCALVADSDTKAA